MLKSISIITIDIEKLMPPHAAYLILLVLRGNGKYIAVTWLQGKGANNKENRSALLVRRGYYKAVCIVTYSIRKISFITSNTFVVG